MRGFTPSTPAQLNRPAPWPRQLAPLALHLPISAADVPAQSEEQTRLIHSRQWIGLPHRPQEEQESGIEKRQVVGDRSALSARCFAEAHLPHIAPVDLVGGASD